MNTIAAPKRRIKLSLDTFDFMFIAANAIVRNHNSINSTGISSLRSHSINSILGLRDI